jgi:hypothetical protein
MKRITDKILYALQDAIKEFFPDFTLGARYDYWCPEYHYPKGSSGTESFDTGLTAKEAYYWMQGFKSAYYKVKEGVIPPPRLAPAGKKLWVVVYKSEKLYRRQVLLVDDKLQESDIIDIFYHPDDKPFVDAICIEESDVYVFNSPVDTQGEQDAI